MRLLDAVTLLLADSEPVLLAVFDTDGVCRGEGHKAGGKRARVETVHALEPRNENDAGSMGHTLRGARARAHGQQAVCGDTRRRNQEGKPSFDNTPADNTMRPKGLPVCPSAFLTAWR